MSAQNSNVEINCSDSKPEEQTNTSKKKYEYVWRGFFVVVLIVGAILFQKVYTFQTNPHFDDIKAGTVTDMLIYGLPFAVVFSLFDLLIHHLFDDLCERYYITEERYVQPQSRRRRCYTLVKWGYTSLYYLISSVWAYMILKETTFMPTWLGGKGSPFSMSDALPRVSEATIQMKVFYILQFGKHFSRTFNHLFIRPEGNYFEYALHHGLSTFLIVFSYLTNQWLIGIFVLFVHDYSDFGLTIGRGYKDCKYQSRKILNMLYVHGFIAWISCRIILFVSVCIVPAFITLLNCHKNLTEYEYSVLQFPYAFMVFMMASLEVMHIFWTYFIVESFVSVNISAKLAKHSYD